MSSTKIKNVSMRILACLLLSGCHAAEYQQEQKALKVVATTSLIGSIVERVGGERVDVVTIIPSGMCPGHFDIKPGDVKMLEKAQILLQHGFAGESFLNDMLNLVDNPELLKMTMNVEGNWMVPDIHIQAVDKIAEVLCQADPGGSIFFKSAASNYKDEIKGLGMQIQAEAERLTADRIRVACSKMQTQFVEWLGFDIVTTFERPENLNPQKFQRIIKKARAGEVKLIIDNLQSGGKGGLPIAYETGGAHIILTNFPLEYEGKVSYPKSLKENADKLFKGLRKNKIDYFPKEAKK